jgi:hypothetical protein
MRSTSRILAAVTGGLLLAAPAAPALAEGQQPTVTHFEIVDPEPIVDDVLTPACGFTVYSAIHLSGVELSFTEGHPSGLGFQESYRNDVVFSANGKSLTFVERGHAAARFQRDGTVTFTLAGREFGNSIIGRKVLTFNPETGELLDVAYVGQSLNLADFCAALTP